MFDILVFLFESYHPQPCPDSEVLARKLSAAGFDDDDISATLEWLAGLPPTAGAMAACSGAVRIYDHGEIAKLATGARGFLAFLEQAGAIDAAVREAVVERAMALPEATVSLDKVKIIVLMVMWRRHLPLGTLLLEELLVEEEGGRIDRH